MSALNRSGAVARYVRRGGAGARRRSSSIPTAARSLSMARTETYGWRIRSFTMNRLADAVDYFDGESA